MPAVDDSSSRGILRAFFYRTEEKKQGLQVAKNPFLDKLITDLDLDLARAEELEQEEQRVVEQDDDQKVNGPSPAKTYQFP